MENSITIDLKKKNSALNETDLILDTKQKERLSIYIVTVYKEVFHFTCEFNYRYPVFTLSIPVCHY